MKNLALNLKEINVVQKKNINLSKLSLFSTISSQNSCNDSKNTIDLSTPELNSGSALFSFHDKSFIDILFQEKIIETTSSDEQMKHSHHIKVKTDDFKDENIKIRDNSNTKYLVSPIRMKCKQNFDSDILKFHPFRKLLFSLNLTKNIFNNYLIKIYNSLIFIKEKIKYPVDLSLTNNKIMLFKKDKEKNLKTLFLDVDETIIYIQKNINEFSLEFLDENREKIKFGIEIRPYFFEFITKLKEFYEIILYSNFSINQIEIIADYLDPNKKMIDGVLSLENCIETNEGYLVKDLNLIKNRDLKNMVIVSNSVKSFAFNINNGVPIRDWKGEKNDKELKYLAEYLIQGYQYEDMREYNIQNLKLDALSKLKESDLKL